MHIGIFASPERGTEVRTVMRSVRKHAIAARGVTIASGWEHADGDALRQVLGDATHLLLLPGLDATEWIPYLIGYANGRGMPVAVVGDVDIAAVYGTVHRVGSDKVENYLLSERSGWERQRAMDVARSRLRGRERDPRAFCDAAHAGDLELVRDFIAVGVTPDTRNAEGVPVLVAGVRGRSVEVVQVLLAGGADPNATCGNEGTSALCEAASGGLDTVLGVLLAAGADVNHVTSSGQTALMLASSQGHESAVDRLLAAGARADKRDSLGMTAIEYARLFGRTAIVELLDQISGS